MIIRFFTPITFARAVFRTLKFLALGRPVLAPKSVQDERYAVCRACRWYLDGQCTVCTCFVSMKVVLSAESCPEKPPRWKKLTFSKPTPKHADQA